MKRIKINKTQYNRLGDIILKEQLVKLPRKFEEIPGGQHNYRTNQPSLQQLAYIIKNYDIKNVIRMNGEEGTGVTPQAEEREVEGLDANYYFINAHAGFEKGEGYLTSMDEALSILEEGHTLIHCTGGRDRTGYIVAEYLQRNFGWDKDRLWEYTVDFNNWEYHICNNTGNKGYIKYMEGFYPLDEWCENYDPDNRCPNCSDVVVIDIPDEDGHYHGDKEVEIPSTGDKITDFDRDLGGKLIKRYGGNSKEDVERIQTMLYILGYNIGKYGPNKDGIDGKFGPYTQRGVQDFQKDVFSTNPSEWDGIVGPKTYEKLIEKIDEVAQEEGVDREELLNSFRDSEYDEDKISKDIEYDEDDVEIEIRDIGGDEEVYKTILLDLGVNPTPEKMKFLYAWRQAESGTPTNPSHHVASNNPFNTTWSYGDGSTSSPAPFYNCLKHKNGSKPGTVAMRNQYGDQWRNYCKSGVRHYPTIEDGINYTVKTLNLGYYDDLTDMLRDDNISAMELASSPSLSTWGTGGGVKRVLGHNTLNPKLIYRSLPNTYA